MAGELLRLSVVRRKRLLSPNINNIRSI